jgi:transposase-like protein
VASIATDLGVSDQTVYTWRKQELIDTGQVPGLTTVEAGELRAAKRRIAELETELAVTRRANELLREQVTSPKGGSRQSR